MLLKIEVVDAQYLEQNTVMILFSSLSTPELSYSIKHIEVKNIHEFQPMFNREFSTWNFIKWPVTIMHCD